MGTSNSCLPVSLDTFHTLRSRSSTSKLKYDVHEAFNHDKNAIDINKVTEDELLLLPGITRQLAFQIIRYRVIHDGFKRINDLLNIDGITSEIFKRIYYDITIDSSISSNNKQELVNLNFASYRELSSIPGLTSNLVKRIIQRRERKGSFQFIEDLLKIKGIDYIILATVRPHVTVNQPKVQTWTSDYSLNTFPPLSNRTTANDTLSLASILLETLPPELQTILVASPPHRLSKVDDSKQKVLRFASWNLQQLTNEKVQNPGVREVICRVILENNFSLIGIQEIGNQESLQVIIQELNNPTIPSIKNWPHRHRRKWNYVISDTIISISQGSEYLGMIYDEASGIELKQASLLSSSSNPHCSRSPFVTLFRIYKKFEFVFVNIHLQSKRLENEPIRDKAKALSLLVQAMENTLEQKHIVIFGSFNMTPTAPEFQVLMDHHYSYIIQQNTDIDAKNLKGSTCTDNIWLSTDAKTLSTEHSGVIRDNLTSLWIPAGWTWGGLVSDHCPIWFELDFS